MTAGHGEKSTSANCQTSRAIEDLEGSRITRDASSASRADAGVKMRAMSERTLNGLAPPVVEGTSGQVRMGQSLREKIGDSIVGVSGEFLDRVTDNRFGVAAEFADEVRQEGESAMAGRAQKAANGQAMNFSPGDEGANVTPMPAQRPWLPANLAVGGFGKLFVLEAAEI